MQKRLRAKLMEVGETLRKQRHAGIVRQGTWLGRVLRGYYQYHAVPGNMSRLESFRNGVISHWRQALKRRSQRHRLHWERFGQWCGFWLPKPKLIMDPRNCASDRTPFRSESLVNKKGEMNEEKSAGAFGGV